ncbi:hypothetical protein HC026_03405 [Lactobacillus sp. LC28-10]|uniref:Extracellular protein n=1 Tax=Secundilactobacillus angelensis TaxID=2722706 RepID=A0ABX1KVL3_9LACO|nr:hypothetical protein [Secundilactobacillus angelensis]MCH5461671.1 hypothetical protein [Secundilactobacillus angelensis]NLR17967.1 hypothetical protein [Secundilactobacillus angelensis]
MKLQFKRYILVGLVAVATLLGFNALSTTASAHTKYTTTPTSLRGTWFSKSSGGDSNKLKITKYTFSVYYYHNGKKSDSTWTLSGKKSPSSYSRLNYTKKSKSGYYSIVIKGGDQGWPLKRTTHHGKATLVTWGWDPIHQKTDHSYFYKK